MPEDLFDLGTVEKYYNDIQNGVLYNIPAMLGLYNKEYLKSIKNTIEDICPALAKEIKEN